MNVDEVITSLIKEAKLKAEAVYNYFISTGLNGDICEVVERGEDFPIANNSSQKSRRKNRVVVLIRVDQ